MKKWTIIITLMLSMYGVCAQSSTGESKKNTAIVHSSKQSAEFARELLTAGKMEEESNLNPEAAIKKYAELIKHYELMRPSVAEALFRQAECERKLEHTENAQANYVRLMREFPEQGELVSKAQMQLANVVGKSGNRNVNMRLHSVVAKSDDNSANTVSHSSVSTGTAEDNVTETVIHTSDNKGHTTGGTLVTTSAQPKEKQKSVVRKEETLRHESDILTEESRKVIGASTEDDLAKKVRLAREALVADELRMKQMQLSEAQREFLLAERQAKEAGLQFRQVLSGRDNPNALAKPAANDERYQALKKALHELQYNRDLDRVDDQQKMKVEKLQKALMNLIEGDMLAEAKASMDEAHKRMTESADQVLRARDDLQNEILSLQKRLEEEAKNKTEKVKW